MTAEQDDDSIGVTGTDIRRALGYLAQAANRDHPGMRYTRREAKDRMNEFSACIVEVMADLADTFARDAYEAGRDGRSFEIGFYTPEMSRRFTELAASYITLEDQQKESDSDEQ